MNLKKLLIHFLIFTVAFASLVSCSPELMQERSLSSENISDNDPDTEPPLNDGLPVINYFHQGGISTSSTLSLYSDFQDSFLLRGRSISNYLASLTNPFEKTYCFIGFYPNSSDNKILLMQAKVKSHLDYSSQKNEFYFQMEAQNSESNTQNCLTSSVLNYITNKFSNNMLAMTLGTFCPSCSSTQTSQTLEIITSTGEVPNQFPIGHLSLSLNFQASGGNETINSCQSNVTCTAQGYNCCLANQCVNHAAVRSDVDQMSTEFLNSQAAIQNDPSLIINYQHLYYVCPTMVSTNPDNNPDPIEDPEEVAANLFTKLRHLYQCLNTVQDEFSICTLKFEDASEIMNGSGIFTSSDLKDDLTITPHNTITEIEYAGLTKYKQKLFSTDTEVVADPSQISFSSPAASNIFSAGALNHFQTITAHIPIPTNAINDILYLRYKVDGSCEKLGTSLARCTKTYVQGQSSTPTRPSDHSSASSYFALPSYANITSFAVSVSLGGLAISEGNDTWQKSGQGIQFIQPVYNNQTVEITYFVAGLANVESVTKSKTLAQNEVNNICSCDENCNLKPVYSETDSSQIVTYECLYPDNNDNGPLQKVVYLSAKSVPHRFYDTNGVYYPFGEVPETSVQEGKEFKYKNTNNFLRPDYDNGTDIGFNEIYGSFNKTEVAPMPSTVVTLEKGKSYDIFADEGAFSTCLNCGTDPYSSMVKLFPQNFSHKGAGYLPDFVESRRQDNRSKYPADDKLFGRACFVPATMIPWTHVADADVTTQRRNRLKAQHFMFANGYNRDWYGFDYGALIGSFDGVKWFAIGNQRKITAKSNRLFLAINAYFGDVTMANNFTIMVNESASIINSGSTVDHDLKSDGAECQVAHLCKVDRDCFTQLGPEYSCQNISSLRTSWPQFDSNGNEISGSLDTTLISLIGGTGGEAKRCVYRGRGALCHPNAHSVTESLSYGKSTNAGIHMCSGNNYCESLASNRFNSRISRYASSVNNQNNSSYVTDKTDTYGLGARILGRPYDFFGTQTVPSDIRTQLLANTVSYMCIPGKETVSLSKTEDLNSRQPASRRADKMFNIGITQIGVGQDPLYYAACSAVDSYGNYTYNSDLDITSTEHKAYTISQNISSNALDRPFLDSLNLFNDGGNQISALGLNHGSCLKTAGSPCFTDLDCGPSNFIAGKVSTISSFLGQFNQAEENFWKEGLVCANNQERYLDNSIYPNPIYNLNKNRCCRELGKKFTYFTDFHEDHSMNTVDSSGNPLIPGVNQDINDPTKYTSNQIVYDKLLQDPNNYPPLYAASSRPSAPLNDVEAYLKQYNTLQEHNSRMCCTGNWVRSFASGSNGNGGGHTFNPQKLQNTDVKTFKRLNWLPLISNDPNLPAYYGGGPNPYVGIADSIPFACTNDNFQTAACEMRNIPQGSFEEKRWLDYFGRLELLGIPQVLIPTNLLQEDGSFPFASIVNSDQLENTANSPLPGKALAEGAGIPEVVDGDKRYYSAASYDNFDLTKLKKVFSENEFNCCLPTGVEVEATTTNNLCCSGQVTQDDETNARFCCLPDNTDLSLYTNAYVSSEGYKNLNVTITQSDINQETGYIKKEKVMQMAKTMCCSGKAAYGVALSDLYIPITGGASGDIEYNPNAKRRRWIDNDTIDNDQSLGGVKNAFDNGLKWNDHVYCINENDSSGPGGGTTTGGANQQ